MIVNCRIEIDDQARNTLAQLINPRAPKRLATRKEVNEFVEGCIAAIDQDPPELGQDGPTDYVAPPSNRLGELVLQAREEDREALRGKSDSFVIGWCKVKYRDVLRSRV